METLTRVLARHVYNLDLTDLPLDRVVDLKGKRVRKLTNRTETSAPGSLCESGHNSVSRQDSCAPDGLIISKIVRSGLSRSLSETSLALKRKSSQKLPVSCVRFKNVSV